MKIVYPEKPAKNFNVWARYIHYILTVLKRNKAYILFVLLMVGMIANVKSNAGVSRSRVVGVDTTKPVTPKQYSVSGPFGTWVGIDSLLRRGAYFIGRTLSRDEADKEAGNVMAVISFIANQINEQQKGDTLKKK